MSLNFEDNYNQYKKVKDLLGVLDGLIKSVDHMYIPLDDFSEINEKLESVIEYTQLTKQNILQKTNRIQTDVLTDKDLEEAKENNEDHVHMVGKTWTRWGDTKHTKRGRDCRDCFSYVFVNMESMKLFQGSSNGTSYVYRNYYNGSDTLGYHGKNLTGMGQDSAVFDEYVLSELGLYIDTSKKKIKVGRFSDLEKAKK